jgi:hypothetical protein
MEYSDGVSNYERLLETIAYIECGKPITQKWLDLHYNHLCEYRKQFPEFAKVNIDIQDTSFRQMLIECDDLIERMITFYSYHKCFGTADYLQFNKYIVKIVTESDSFDEFDNMLSNLSLSGETN